MPSSEPTYYAVSVLSPERSTIFFTPLRRSDATICFASGRIASFTWNTTFELCSQHSSKGHG